MWCKKNYSNEKNINCELILKRWEKSSEEKNEGIKIGTKLWIIFLCEFFVYLFKFHWRKIFLGTKYSWGWRFTSKNYA